MFRKIVKFDNFSKLFDTSKQYYSNKLKTHIKRRIKVQNVDEIDIHKYATSNKTDKRLYVWGLSETGALGINDSLKKQSQKHTAYVQHPTRHRFGEKFEIITASCGYGFSLFVVETADGYNLFGTGINSDSQLGHHQHRGETNEPIDLLIVPAPIEMSHKDKIIECAAGRAHSLALSEFGKVYSFGNNAYGQCGRKIIEDEHYAGNSIIHEVKIPEKVVNIECGQDHSMFLAESGRVYACGWGSDGQTGLSDFKTAEIPELVEGDIKNERIVKLSSAADCVLALNDRGEVFGWGNSEYGQLGLDDEYQQINRPHLLKDVKKLGKILDIATGGSYCLVLNENHDVFSWGYGILGFGPQVDYAKKPKLLPPPLFGRNEFNSESRVTAIFSGMSHMGAINSDNDLYMWGHNKHGCLGLGHTKDQFFPLRTSIGAKVETIFCGVDHTLALCRGFA